MSYKSGLSGSWIIENHHRYLGFDYKRFLYLALNSSRRTSLSVKGGRVVSRGQEFYTRHVQIVMRQTCL
jgi:hypothetical protein